MLTPTTREERSLLKSIQKAIKAGTLKFIEMETGFLGDLDKVVQTTTNGRTTAIYVIRPTSTVTMRGTGEFKIST